MPITQDRLRLFMLILSDFIFAATAIELYFSEHMGSLVQIIPFILIWLALIAITIFFLRPTQNSIWFLRIAMGLVILGSLFGIIEHFQHRLFSGLEIRPSLIPSEVFLDAIRTVYPLLAPGILAFAGILAIFATYDHPVLKSPSDTGRKSQS